MAFKKNGIQFGLENEDFYHYEAFKYGNVSREELRKEYSRLRVLANRRLDRMEGTRFENSQTYRRNVGKYTTIEELEKRAIANAKNLTPEAAQRYVDSLLAKKLADAYKMLTSKTGSIRGMQAVENSTIETLRERGLTFINKGNIQQFGDYMEQLRTIHRGRMYDSERAVELFRAATKKGINPEEVAADFDYWKTKVEALEQIPKIRNEKQRNAEAYRTILDK